MIQISFSKEDKEVLNYERFHHPHPQVQRKMEALWLKSHGFPHNQITKLTGITGNTLRQYLKMYKEGGIEKVKEVNFYRPQSDLVNHKDSIEEYFRKHPPSTISEAIAKIEELTGIRRGPTQVRKFLKSIGMRCLKVGMVPSKADPDEQEAFKKTHGTSVRRSKLW
jgi:transposase